MPRPFLATLAGTVLTIGLCLGAAFGDPPAAPHAQSETGPRNCGPPPVAWWAQPSNTPAFIGYYVGGGCPFERCGAPRQPSEGTWGWDWSGWCLHRKVDLLWWHGRRFHHGTEAYKTDGPRPLERLHEAAEMHP